ncbi:MAG: YdiU family protein [Pseudomonadota bacterium]
MNEHSGNWQAEGHDPLTPDPVGLKFDNSFARSLEGFYVAIGENQSPDPKLVLLNDALASELGLDVGFLRSEHAVDILSGKHKAEGSSPLAQAYAGHQFGGFSPSLGDGRAMLIGEIIDTNGSRRDLQLKGSGRTPFSRGGDGKAALGPVLREYLVSEAMHALGIPTTRSLAAVTTGENVFRETALPGAVLTRVASSHIRVGTFQFFAARGQEDKVRQLADYAIERHYPELIDHPEKYLHFLRAVGRRQSRLVAKWMSVGFIHGVMNTDNMTISGETIDYGPCAFMDSYRADSVFSSIDEMGRYAYRMQPTILQWNLARLAECLLSLIDPDDRDKAISVATEEINRIPQEYEAAWLDEMRSKIGLRKPLKDDKKLIETLLQVMEDGKADFTQTFRSLAKALEGDRNVFLSSFSQLADAESWLNEWHARLEKENTAIDAMIQSLDAKNPIYIPRNHLVEEGLEAAVSSEDHLPFEQLLSHVTEPYAKKPKSERYEVGASATSAPYVTYCGT